eukprot:3496663-Rhodomonas_salina.3
MLRSAQLAGAAFHLRRRKGGAGARHQRPHPPPGSPAPPARNTPSLASPHTETVHPSTPQQRHQLALTRPQPSSHPGASQWQSRKGCEAGSHVLLVLSMLRGSGDPARRRGRSVVVRHQQHVALHLHTLQLHFLARAPVLRVWLRGVWRQAIAAAWPESERARACVSQG